MDKEKVIERLMALAASSSKRSKAMQLEDVITGVEAAMAKGVSRAEIVKTLSESGLEFTLSYFDTSLKRIRKKRRKAVQENQSSSVRGRQIANQNQEDKTKPDVITNEDVLKQETEEEQDNIQTIFNPSDLRAVLNEKIDLPRYLKLAKKPEGRKKMKIVVINFSGNVGKSTVAAHLLKPRMNNATLFSIETLNDDAASDGVDVETYKGKKYKELQEEIFMLEDAIVDVGASNVEDFTNLMTQYHDSHKQFDYYIVPTVKDKKQTIDTLKTIKSLVKMGIPKKKIRVILNRVEIDDDITDEFGSLFGLEAADNTFVMNDQCVIYNNEAFDQCKDLGVPLADIVADQTDYRAQAKAAKDAGDQEEVKRCVNLCLLKMIAITANKNLDQVYKHLFK